MTPKAWAWFIVLKISEIVGLCLVGVLFYGIGVLVTGDHPKELDEKVILALLGLAVSICSVIVVCTLSNLVRLNIEFAKHLAGKKKAAMTFWVLKDEHR